ncbi:MAG: hypothetical protein ABFD79_12675 [Phycisphaerales bacterium]
MGLKQIEKSPKQRRNEIALLLAAGMLKAEPAIKPLTENFSNSQQKELELSSEIQLNVSN